MAAGRRIGRVRASCWHAFLCLRWENNTGEKGPYGEIHSATIP
jgi:hypothetical protein